MVAQTLLAASFANAQFVMDMSDKQFRDKTGVIILEDLSVGETGLIRRAFCLVGQDLYVSKKEQLLQEKFKYSPNIQAKREVNDLVSIVFLPADNVKEDWNLFFANLAVATLYNCKVDNENFDRFFKIKSINGFDKLSHLMKDKLQ